MRPGRRGRDTREIVARTGTEAVRHFDASVTTPDAVLFNVPDPVVAMFYSRFPAYARLPTAAEFQELRSRGTTVAIYVRDGERHFLQRYPEAVAVPAPVDSPGS